MYVSAVRLTLSVMEPLVKVGPRFVKAIGHGMSDRLELAVEIPDCGL